MEQEEENQQHSANFCAECYGLSPGIVWVLIMLTGRLGGVFLKVNFSVDVDVIEEDAIWLVTSYLILFGIMASRASHVQYRILKTCSNVSLFCSQIIMIPKVIWENTWEKRLLMQFYILYLYFSNFERESNALNTYRYI